ncbi:unnamed protein product, partial [Prorocentrum cordatum]
MLGKVQMLELDFHRSSLDVVCIQEGRAPQCDVHDGVHYRMYAGCADSDGQYGCQVWIATSLTFHPKSVRHVSPRLMTVAGYSVTLQRGLVVVSAHAPTEASTARVKDDFWDSLTAVVLNLRSQFPAYVVLAGLDANGRVQGHGDAIGPCEPEPFTDNGNRLLSRLVACSLMAANTFYEAGYTWRSKHGTTARIDYTLLDIDLFSSLVESRVLPETVLSYTPTEDHRMVMSVVEVSGHDGVYADRPRRAPRINKAKCFDAECCRRFQDATDPEQYATELTDYVHASALKSFGSFKDTPRKPWISPPTWRILRGLAPLRRAASVAGARAVQALLHAAMYAWASLVPSASVPGRVRGRRGGLGWHSGARCGEDRRRLHVLRLTSTMAWRAAAAIRRMIKPVIAEDRRVFIEAKTLEARDAQARGDTRTTSAILRALGGRFTTQQPPHVLRKDGTLTTSEGERQQRWLEHFTDVFHGTPMTLDELRSIPVAPPMADHQVRIGPARVEGALGRLKSNRGTGRDGISAEVLRAGGGAMAVKLSELYQCVVDSEVWPTAWPGSRVVGVHKRKGPRNDCDEYRGIHLDSHLGKVLEDILNEDVKEPYEAGMPPSQYGAVSKRGTDFVSRAFDRAIRELVLGIPHDCAYPSTYLAGLGLRAHQVEWIVEFIAVHVPLMQQWGIPEKIVRLLKNLHSKSWLSYGDVDTAVSVRLGGKQGCKYGSTIFNGSYSVGLLLLRDALLKAGATLRIHDPGPDFVSPG